MKQKKPRIYSYFLTFACAVVFSARGFALPTGGLDEDVSEKGPKSTTGPGRFVSAESMNEARSNHTATRLLNGKVLIVGGHNNWNLLSSSEVFVPASGPSDFLP